MKLSPYRFDLGRLATLVARPNLQLDTLSRVAGSDPSAFPASGLIEIRNAVSHDLCDEAVREHEAFERLCEQTGCVISDPAGRNYRLANFHLKSRALLEIGLSRRFHDEATAFFGRRSTIYTSLFYKHGSQQKAHIDTPYFWTRPFNLFVGVWVALEDVAADAGPLFYYPGSHEHFASEEALREVYETSGRDVQVMFDLIREHVEKSIQPVNMLLRKGDAVIWHPGIMHGGSLATNPVATRHSIVFHFAPLGVNVRHDVFPNDFLNLPTYGVRAKSGQYYCRAALPTRMI